MESTFIDYEPEHGTWSGLPKGLQQYEYVEVIFAPSIDESSTVHGFAYEFGWNKSDIKSWRKVDMATL